MKYIGYFDLQNSKVKRYYITSASNKMDYVAQAIKAKTEDVEIISMSSVTEPKFKLYQKELKDVCEGVTLQLPSSWGGTNIFLTKFRTLWNLAYMFFYLLFRIKKNETILVYHSLGYFDIIHWAKQLRKFKLILETNEIYTDVSTLSPRLKRREYKMFDIADGYLFATELLHEKLNISNKPHCYNHGTYKVEPQIVEKFNDGKIHVVYAGTFDPRKGGAAAAAAAAEFLPENYHVHICGFGTTKETNDIKEIVRQTAQRSKASISFEGLLKGREYIEFIQRCHIGLSTQDPNAAFNATSFPSKILSYMSNGLTVVSIRIEAIEKSAVGGHISYYEEQTPQEIANAIINADITNDNRNFIEMLDLNFQNDIKKLIDAVNQL